jgi:phospholipid/cholesterol/gamma-HCH transport system substrate-binding protein
MQRITTIWVGLFLVLGIVGLLFIALKASNLLSMTSGQTYSVTALFDDIGGLKPRAAVRSAGVLVGRVREIGFDDTRFQAIVVLDLDRRIQFPKDSSAQILTSGLLGEKYIGLQPGADSDMLKESDRIQMTQSAVVLENLISQFLYNRDPASGASGGGSGLSEPANPPGLR